MRSLEFVARSSLAGKGSIYGTMACKGVQEESRDTKRLTRMARRYFNHV